MAVPYKNPISSVQVSTPQSVSRTSVFGTNFSNLNVGGYMEVYNLSDLSLTLTATSYPSLIQLSANTIPIRYTKGNGTFLSPDYLTLNSDNISSGRRRLGMMVYVHETDKVYQYVIPNYDTLWNNLSGLTGFSSVTYSDYTTVINSRSSAGQAFISGWTSSNIEGVSGFTSTNSNWRIFQSGSSGGTVSGDYLPLSGGTVYGPTIFTSGLTANTLNVLGLTQTSGITSTGGITFKQITINSAYTATTSDYMIDVTGGTFNVTLPSAVGIQGRLLVVKNNGGGAVTVQPILGQNIDDKLFVILGETNTIQLASNGSNWVAISYNISTVNSSTGVFLFTGLSIASTTTFNVAPVKGWIVNDTSNPLSTQLYYVEYSGGVHTAIYVNTSTETWVYLTSGGTISQSSIELTEQQRRQNIFLGKLGHANKTNIINAFSQPDFVLSPLAQLRDMFVPINLINGGIYASANGVNLSFNTSAGYLYGLGINFANNTLTPNSLSVSGTSPCTFQYRTQTGGTASNTTFIDPTNYDVGGVITPISGTKASNQRIFLVQNGQFRVQYAQETYTTLAQAIEGLATEQYNTFSNFTTNGILIGILSVLSSATDLSDISKARFFFTSKFGETVGSAGGVSTTTLQQAYDNSSTPEIVINSSEGALSIKNGTGNADNITNLLEGINTTGNTTSFIRADGLFSGSSVSTPGFTANTNGLTATTISATTYLNLPTDIRVTGATYSNNTFTYTNNTGGTFNVLFNTVTGLTVNGNLTVTGNTSLRAFTGTSGTISGTGQNILTVIGSGNSTTSPIFSVLGSNGELFSVSDSLTGSLFSVNDISGLPIVEVFSDSTILMGNYLAPSLNTTVRLSLTAGTNTIYSLPTSAYTGAFVDYTVINSGNTSARAGNIMSIWTTGSTEFTEVSTNDIGSTSGITFSTVLSGNNALIRASATTTGWVLKTIIRSI